MTQLPTTQLDGALALARQRVREYAALGAFEPGAGHALARFQLKVFASSSAFNMAYVKQIARCGWEDAGLALDEMVADFVARGAQLPPQLADYVIDRLHPNLPRPRGPQKATNIMRDIAYVGLISEVSERFGLKPRRNRASRAPAQRPSACFIVAEALKAELPAGLYKGTERALEQVWDKLSLWVFRQGATMQALARS